MQGDVLGPLVSSNMVDHHVGKVALETEHVYMYKDKVKIPPQTMQDDTLGVSNCGYKTALMSEFLNTRTKIMNLQCGCDKCSQIHIGKVINEGICTSLSVDAWDEELVNGEKIKRDKYRGREVIKKVKEKKYLGDVISSNGSNRANINQRSNKAHGNVNRIVTTLNERPYGKHFF